MFITLNFYVNGMSSISVLEKLVVIKIFNHS